MTALVRFEAARQALAEAQRVDEVKDIRDKAEAMAAYARQAKDTELIQYATEIKVRAERRCGEMLKAAAASGQRATRGRPEKTSHDATFSTLADLGLTRDESSRYQKLAAMPEKHFEAAVATAKAAAGEVTTARMLREAKKVNGESAGRKPSSRRPAAKKTGSAATVATETASPVTPEQLAPGPVETKPAEDDALGDFDPYDEIKRMQAELDAAHALVKAAEADDLKAEAMKWRRAYDHAQREQSIAMDRYHNEAKLHKFKHRQLMRCGKAVGEEDPDKVASAVEAFVRMHKVAA